MQTEHSLDGVNKVTAEVVKQAAAALKPHKMDVSHDFSSGALLHTSDLFFSLLALVFRSLLRHGKITKLVSAYRTDTGGGQVLHGCIWHMALQPSPGLEQAKHMGGGPGGALGYPRGGWSGPSAPARQLEGNVSGEASGHAPDLFLSEKLDSS